jgi:sugar O-acyltransferase (sialic acid O-acetyltransferase NeuD family)
MNNIIIIGTSDLFEMTETSLDPQKYKIGGYLAPKENSNWIYKNYPYLGDDSLLESDSYRDHSFVVALFDNKRRQNICDILESQNLPLLSVIHPSSVVMASAKIENGTTISFLCTISSSSKIGKCVVIRSHAHIAHDVSIGDYSFVAPGVCLLAGVQVGKGSLIGANATIFPGVKIGDQCKIGVGSIVRHDVPSETTYISKYLTYSKSIKKNDEL